MFARHHVSHYQMFTWCSLKSGAGSHDAVTLHNTKGQSATITCIPSFVHMHLDQSHEISNHLHQAVQASGDVMPSPCQKQQDRTSSFKTACILYEEAWK